MRSLITILVAFVLVVTGCGGSSGSDVATPGNSADDGPESFEDLDFSSPIGDFLGFDFNANDDMEEQFAEMEREAGRLTAACMLEKGFEYTPLNSESFASFGPGGDDVPYFSDEWVDKYGFGITTQRFPQSQVGDLVGYPDGAFSGPDDGFVDPNQEYLKLLSEGERYAYQEALYGPSVEVGPDGPDEEFEYEPSGCQNEAFEQAFSDGPGDNFEAFFESFGDELQAMEERAQSDPRVIEFNDKVTECVSAKGMVWVDQQELFERFERRLSDLQPAAMSEDSFEAEGVNSFEAEGVNSEEMTDRELEDFFQDLNRLDPAGLATLGELQAEELALARVVIDCGGGPLNEQVVLGEIRAEYEQSFLDANASELEEFESD